MPADALLIVDVQNDFCPGGSLAVLEGNHIVPVANEYLQRAHERGWALFVSRDWHPARTKHFQEFGGVWPPHCVQGTPGAEFHPGLRLPPETVVISKGMDPEKDAYSVFDAFTPDGKPLAEELRRRGVQRLYVGGLATDYCVKWTATAALGLGFQVTVLLDASRGVNLKPHDSEEAIEEMVRAGATIATMERAFGQQTVRRAGG